LMQDQLILINKNLNKSQSLKGIFNIFFAEKNMYGTTSNKTNW